MQDAPEPSISGPETGSSASPVHPLITRRRSLAQAVSWRVVGSLDTLLLSFLLITYLGPMFGLEHSPREAMGAASLIALTEVATKMVLYYLHERFWEWNRWGTELLGTRRRESYRRSTTKTATWRVLASLDTTLLAWLFTGSVATALSIGGLEVATKLVLYFFHERVWANIGYGIVAGAPSARVANDPLDARLSESAAS